MSHNRPGVAQGGSRMFRLPDFHDTRQMKMVRFSASRTGRLYPQKMLLVLIFTKDCVDPRAMVRSEGNMSLKNPVTILGTDPGTVRLVAQRLNHYVTRGPRRLVYHWRNSPRCPLLRRLGLLQSRLWTFGS